MIKEKYFSIFNFFKLHLANPKIQKALLSMEVLLCLFIFFTLSGGKGVDWDESFTHELVTYNNVLGIISETAADVHPPLYYLIVKLFTVIFGNKLVVYTWASIAGGIGCMILNSTLIYKRFGVWVSGLLNILFAFAPTVLFYNLNIRMYSWTLFFCLGCLLFACELMDSNTIFNWIMLFLFSICGVYTQYFAVFPIVSAYICLILHFLTHKTWKKFIFLGIVCILNVISFIPWLLYAPNQFKTSGIQQEYIDNFHFIPTDFFEFACATTLENIHVMQMVLFFFSIIIFFIVRKDFSPNEQWFLGTFFFSCLFCFFGSQILAIFGNHFYTWRYIYPIVAFIWIVLTILLTKLGNMVYIPFCLWSLILCLYSYDHVYEWEYEMTPLLEHTVAFTDANIEDGCVIVQDYGNFDTLYRFYLPGHEFIHFDELDLSSFEKGETFWFIQLGGSYFTEGMIDAYGLEIEHFSGFGYMGMVKFELEKVTVTK